MFVMTLRKGPSRVFLQYGGSMADGISARDFVAEVRDDAAVVRFELKPGSDDERSDARKLDRDELTRIAIHDDQIGRELARFREHGQAQGRSLYLEIVYKEFRYKFHAELELGEYESVIHVGAPST